MSTNRPIEFTSLPMMTLRSSPGEVLDRVARNGEAFIIERSGQQLACLLPVSMFLPDVDQKRFAKDREELDNTQIPYDSGVSSDKEIYFKIKRDEFSITIVIPNGYPNNCPRIYADAIDDNCPHRWQDGSLCIFGAIDSWNPGTKSLLDVLSLTEKWLSGYKQWKRTGEWQSDKFGDREA